MFGGFNAALSRYVAAQRDLAALPHREVTRAEFRRLLVASGMDKREVRMQTNRSLGGAWLRVGDEMLRIKE